MIKPILLILFFIISIIANGQLINTKPTEIPLAPLNFNSSVVKQNKVKSILVVILDKPDGEVIIDKGATQGYEFDKEGNLTRYYYTILNSTGKKEVDVSEIVKRGKVVRPAGTKTVTSYHNDTIFANLFYDNQQRVITKRVQTEDYYDAYYYEYNAEGKVKKETHCKETNISENKKEFKMGVQSILSVETFEYTQLTPTQIKKSCLNDEGREYKKAIINYDTKGNKLDENYEFTVSWMHESFNYKYDTENKLIEKIYSGNTSGDIKTQSNYEYHANGSVLTEKKLKNDVLSDELNYLYDAQFNLVKSQANREHLNASIGIVKYGYTFYE